jgi:hypothetical protein
MGFTHAPYLIAAFVQAFWNETNGKQRAGLPDHF